MEKSERRDYQSRNKIQTDINFRKSAHPHPADIKKTVRYVEKSKSRENVQRPKSKQTKQDNADIDKEIEIL